MIIAGTASVGALVLGSLAAYGLVRGNFIGRRILETNFIAPLIVPPVVNAIALYIIYARVGLLGSFSGLIAAHIVIAAPYVGASAVGRDPRVRSADRAGGGNARRLSPHRSGMVLFPNLLPSLIAAWVLAFVVSFDELILTFFLFGTYDTFAKAYVRAAGTEGRSDHHRCCDDADRPVVCFTPADRSAIAKQRRAEFR